MPEGTFITHEQLQKIMEAAIRAARTPTPLEEKELQETVEKERRRNLMMIELGKIEEQRQNARRTGCSHRRDKSSGLPVARNEPGEWTTGGHLTGVNDDIACLICVRCAWTWRFKPTPQEREYLKNSEKGFSGFAPPAEERCIREAEQVA